MIRKCIEKYSSLPVQVKASFWFLISGFFARGISIITTPIFTRLFSTVEYGEYSVFNSWYGIVSVFITLNLYCGVFTQGMVKYSSQKKEFASSLQCLCLVLVTLWTFIYLAFKEEFNNFFSLTTPQMLLMILMIWLNTSFQFWSVEQRVECKYRLLVFITIMVTILKPILGIFFVINSENKVLARILGLAIVELIAYTWTFFYQVLKGRKFYSKKFWKHALLFNIPLLPHYLSMTILNSADRIMIEKLCGFEQAGIYNLAYSISQIMIIFNTSLMQTIEPWLYKRIKYNQIKDISKVAIPSFVIIAFVNIGLMLFAPEIVSIFAPKSYYEAVWIIPPVAMGVYFMFSYTFFAVFEFYYEKTKYIMGATTSGAILNIFLNYIFIKKYGYIAAGYTTLICYVLFSLFHYYFMRKICIKYHESAQPYDSKLLFLITAFFVVVGFAILITYKYTILRYLLICLTIVILLFKYKSIKTIIVKMLEFRKS